MATNNEKIIKKQPKGVKKKGVYFGVKCCCAIVAEVIGLATCLLQQRKKLDK